MSVSEEEWATARAIEAAAEERYRRREEMMRRLGLGCDDGSERGRSQPGSHTPALKHAASSHSVP